jgi:hypothetical protein
LRMQVSQLVRSLCSDSLSMRKHYPLWGAI